MRLFLHWSVALTPALATSITANAQERDWSGDVAIGRGARPDDLGSEDLQAMRRSATASEASDRGRASGHDPVVQGGGPDQGARPA